MSTTRSDGVQNIKAPSKQLMYYRRKCAKIDEQYAEWVRRIAEIGMPTKFLTDEQWLEACTFFRGCALCNSTSIDARGFFVHRIAGGHYCNWNVIPVCEQCATELKRQVNPFRHYCQTLNKNLNTARGLHSTKIERIASYLRPKLEEATRHNDTVSSTAPEHTTD